ncbi:MAG: hypothetical protein HC915_04780 [Anaerolineae bacterium]|nr:hypothetical protein [Anaerolineae bacterium]
MVEEEYQIVEARAAGADAVTLPAALLSPEQLRNLISITQRNRMTEVVLVRSAEEVLAALPYQPRVFALSNRDPHDFSINLETTLRLRELIPPDVVVISSGGIRTPQDLAYVVRAGIDAVMVGQALLTAPDTAQAIEELFKLTPAS